MRYLGFVVILWFASASLAQADTDDVIDPRDQWEIIDSYVRSGWLYHPLVDKDGNTDQPITIVGRNVVVNPDSNSVDAYSFCVVGIKIPPNKKAVKVFWEGANTKETLMRTGTCFDLNGLSNQSIKAQNVSGGKLILFYRYQGTWDYSQTTK